MKINFLKYSPVILSRAVASSGLLVLNFVLSHLYSSTDLGYVSVSISIAIGFSVILKFGLDSLSIKLVGIYFGAGLSDEISTYWYASTLFVFLSGVVGIVFFVFPTEVASNLFQIPADLWRSSLILGWALAFGGVLGGIFRASGRAAIGQIFDIGGFAVIFSLILVLISAFYSNIDLNILFLVSVLLYFLAIFLFSGKFILAASLSNFLKSPVRQTLNLFWPQRLSIVSLFGVTLLAYCSQWLGILISSVWLDPKFSALISIAQRFSMVIFLLLGTIGSIQGPKYAYLFSEKLYADILKQDKKVTWIMVILVLPLALGFVCFPEVIMKIFGIEDPSFSLVLRFLVVGQFINILTGCSSHMMVAFGFEQKILFFNLCSAIAGTASSLFLVQVYGVSGVAFGMAIGLVVSPCLAFFYTRKLLSK